MLAYVQIALRKADEREVLEKLQDHKEVKEAHILFGEWDMMIKLEISSSEELGSFVMEHIRSLPEVKLTSTMIVAK